MINSICFQGRLTADPEVKKTASDVSFCSLTIAWSEKFKETETKCFLRCKAWRSTADFIGKYFHKGEQIAIQGRLETEEWKDKDGSNRSATVCNIEKVSFCGNKSDTAAVPDTKSAPTNDGFVNLPEGIDEELPFN